LLERKASNIFIPARNDFTVTHPFLNSNRVTGKSGTRTKEQLERIRICTPVLNYNSPLTTPEYIDSNIPTPALTAIQY